MTKGVRTIKTLKNAQAALILSAIGFVVSFFFRKIFINTLGADLLGLNTTAYNLLEFINLAELGIGTAIAFSLYKPLAENDTNTINEIVSVQGRLYRYIAYIVLASSAVLMFFFPWIFKDITFPMSYTYATFIVLLISSLLGYFVNYKQIVLSANQENYKITYSYNLIIVLKQLAQLLAIYFLNNPYLWWLFLEVLFAIIASVILNIVIKRSCPYLKTSIKLGKQVSNKYPHIIKKTKQLFVHRIAGFVLLRAQPLIIFAYTSLSIVAYYGNYLLIINGLNIIIRSLSNGEAASVGNLISNSKQNRILAIFEELFTLRFWITSSLALTAYFLATPFIEIWIGGEYLLNNITLILMLTTFFMMGIRSTVDNYISAYGLFHDIWAPITEAIINLSLSILLGSLYGINGVLSGAIISLIIIIMGWKPYFLFKYGLKESYFTYLKIFSTHLISLLCFIMLIKVLKIDFYYHLLDNDTINFILNGIIVLSTISIALGLLFLLTTKGMRNLLLRAVLLVSKKTPANGTLPDCRSKH